MAADRSEKFFQVLGRGADHPQLGVARIIARVPTRISRISKRPSSCHDLIKHLGQDQAVDDVADDFDVFDVGRGAGRRGRHVRQAGRRGVH